MRQAPSFERVVVTGATGFVGRHLLEELVAAGHRPIAVARRIEQAEGSSFASSENVRWVKLDLLEHDAVRTFLKAVRPTIIFHLAGTRGFGNDARKAVKSCNELNVDATRRLLEVSTRTGAERIVIIGSAEEYGNQTGPFDETLSLKPTSHYGKSKAEATRLSLDLHERISCPVVVLRLFTVYGPYQPAGMFVSDAIGSAVNNVSFSMSEGTQERDLVYIDDVKSALVAAAKKPGIEGHVFNVGSGSSIRLVDLAQMIWKLSRSSASLNIGALLRKDDDMQVTCAVTSLAKRCLGWSPKTDLEAGLCATIEWSRRNSKVQ